MLNTHSTTVSDSIPQSCPRSSLKSIDFEPLEQRPSSRRRCVPKTPSLLESPSLCFLRHKGHKTKPIWFGTGLAVSVKSSVHNTVTIRTSYIALIRPRYPSRYCLWASQDQYSWLLGPSSLPNFLTPRVRVARHLRIVDSVSVAALSVYLGPFRLRGWVNRPDGL